MMLFRCQQAERARWFSDHTSAAKRDRYCTITRTVRDDCIGNLINCLQWRPSGGPKSGPEGGDGTNFISYRLGTKDQIRFFLS